ncbi:hypothetical protein Tco_1379121 [Tanacetum coccineum]
MQPAMVKPKIGGNVNFKIKRGNTRYALYVDSTSSSEGIAAIISKLDSLGRDIKKLEENVHAIQVGCQTCGGAHLDKEFPLNEEVKSLEEVKYGERFSDNEKQETNESRMEEALAALKIIPKIKQVQRIENKANTMIFGLCLVLDIATSMPLGATLLTRGVTWLTLGATWLIRGWHMADTYEVRGLGSEAMIGWQIVALRIGGILVFIAIWFLLCLDAMCFLGLVSTFVPIRVTDKSFSPASDEIRVAIFSAMYCMECVRISNGM